MNLEQESLDLVSRYRSGDKRALKRLCKLHEKFIFWAANKYSCGLIDKEDAINQAWIGFLERVATLPLPAYGSFMGYVAPQVRGRVLRSAKRNTQMPETSALTDFEGRVCGCNITAVWLKQAISDLSPREQAVLSAKYVEGYTQEEVASALGISQQRVQQIEAKSLKHLKKVLGGR